MPVYAASSTFPLSQSFGSHTRLPLPRQSAQISDRLSLQGNRRPQFTGKHSPNPLEAFFLPLEHTRNPFAEKLSQLETDPELKKQTKRYKKSLDDTLSARVTKSVIGTVMALGAYYISQFTGSPVVGILTGGATSPFLDGLSRSIVSTWQKPPALVDKKQTLEHLSQTIQNGALVQEVGKNLPERANLLSSAWERMPWPLHGVRSFRSNAEHPVTLICTALISRYPEHQEALKKALPSLRGSYLAKKTLLPALRDAVPHRNYGSVSHSESPAVQQAIQTMLDFNHHERHTLGHQPTLRAEAETYHHHLRQALPKLIEYLEGDPP